MADAEQPRFPENVKRQAVQMRIEGGSISAAARVVGASVATSNSTPLITKDTPSQLSIDPLFINRYNRLLDFRNFYTPVSRISDAIGAKSQTRGRIGLD